MYRKNHKPQIGARQGFVQKKLSDTPDEPIRKIFATYRSVTGWMWSSKNQRLVQHESLGEKRVFLALEFDPKVLSYCEQPITIFYTDENGKNREFTPDVFVKYDPNLSNTPSVIAEIKYASEVQDPQKWKELKPRLQAGLDYAKANGLAFALWTDWDLNPHHHHSAMALRTFFRSPVEPALETKVIKRLQEMGRTTVGDLQASLSQEGEELSRLSQALWSLVASAKIYADLATTPSPQTWIWPVSRKGGAHALA
jgi:hypothetical protein